MTFGGILYSQHTQLSINEENPSSMLGLANQKYHADVFMRSACEEEECT